MQYAKDREGVPLQDQSFYKISNGSRVAGDYVGYSSYDLVTNASAPNRLLVYPDNKVSAVWTGSTSTAEARTDRGTFLIIMMVQIGVQFLIRVSKITEQDFLQ